MKPLVVALACSTLAACSTLTSGPDYRQPNDALASQSAAARPFVGATASVFIAKALPDQWWQLYHDARLDGLVHSALQHNRDLKIAAANLSRVSAIEDEVAGGKKPTIAISANPYYGHPSGVAVLQPGYEPPNKARYSASFGVSYDLDLFGKLSRASEAAAADREAAAAALDLARVNIAASTARAYAEICATGLRIQSAEKSVQLQREAFDVSTRLQQAGRVSTLDRDRAQSQLNQLKAALPPLIAARQGALYRLAVLTGQLPEDFSREIAQCTSPPQLTQLIPVGDGASLIRRRPDIREAERSLAAATARIGMNMADRYPKISLGLLGVSASTTADFAQKDSIAWSLGPLISWTLPNNGVVDAKVAQAEASTQMALAKFDATLLKALQETETALTNYAQELDRQTALKAARDDAAKVNMQTRRLYQNGKIDYLQALDAERSLAAAGASLASSVAALADDQVQLFLALGGGWQTAVEHTMQ